MDQSRLRPFPCSISPVNGREKNFSRVCMAPLYAERCSGRKRWLVGIGYRSARSPQTLGYRSDRSARALAHTCAHSEIERSPRLFGDKTSSVLLCAPPRLCVYVRACIYMPAMPHVLLPLSDYRYISRELNNLLNEEFRAAFIYSVPP